jgi:hypothetical protein
MSNDYEDYQEVLLKAKKEREQQEQKEKGPSVQELVKEAQEKEAADKEVQNNVESATTDNINKEESDEVTDEDALAAIESDENTSEKESDNADESSSEHDKKHRSRSAEKRIGKLVKELSILKGQLQAYQQFNPSQFNDNINYQEVQATQPSLSDFDGPDPSKYQGGTDSIDYKVDMKLYQIEQEKKNTEFKTKIQEGMSKYSDMQELMAMDSTPVTPVMEKLIKNSPVAVDLFYYLLKNSDVALRLSKSSPEFTAKEIGKIEAKLELVKEQKKDTQTTKAAPKKVLPPPITPNKGTKAAPQTKSRYEEY